MSYDPKPKKCNLCGGLVIFNKASKDKSVSGFVYYCTNCHSWVGTYQHRPDIAYGPLADFNTRKKRADAHHWFDKLWSKHEDRENLYTQLAQEMGIERNECHFGMFDEAQCDKAIEIIKKWWLEKFDK